MHIYNIVVKDKKEKTIATETKVVFGIYIQPYNLVISIYIYIYLHDLQTTSSPEDRVNVKLGVAT